jgi:hypothetical protein
MANICPRTLGCLQLTCGTTESFLWALDLAHDKASMAPLVSRTRAHFTHAQHTSLLHTLHTPHTHQTHTRTHTTAAAYRAPSSSPSSAIVPSAERLVPTVTPVCATFILPNAGRTVPAATAPDAGRAIHGPRCGPPLVAPPPLVPRRARSDRGHLLSRPVPPHHRRGPTEWSSRASPPPSGERPASAASPYRRVPSP